MMSITCYSMRLLCRYWGVGDLLRVSWGCRKCYVHNPPGDYFKVSTKECNQVPQIQIVLGDGTNHKEDKAMGSVYASLKWEKSVPRVFPSALDPPTVNIKLVCSLWKQLANRPSSNWIFSSLLTLQYRSPRDPRSFIRTRLHLAS